MKKAFEWSTNMLFYAGAGFLVSLGQRGEDQSVKSPNETGRERKGAGRIELPPMSGIRRVLIGGWHGNYDGNRL